MQKITILFALVALAAVVSALPYRTDEPEIFEVSPRAVYDEVQRQRRDTKKDDQKKDDDEKDGKWVFNPNLGKGEDGNTKGKVEIKRQDDDSTFEAGYERVVDGPDRGDDTWYVGGSYSW